MSFKRGFETPRDHPTWHNTGEVQFIESEGGSRTTVVFKLEHQMPNLLLELRVMALGVENSCR